MNIGKTLSDSGAGAWRANCPNWSVSAAKRASQGVLVVKNLPANAGDMRDVGSVLSWEDPLEEGIRTEAT